MYEDAFAEVDGMEEDEFAEELGNALSDPVRKKRIREMMIAAGMDVSLLDDEGDQP